MHAALVALTLSIPLAGPARAQRGPDAKIYMYGEPGPGRYEYGAPRPRHRPPPPPADDDWNLPPPPPPPPYDAYDRPRDRWRGPEARRQWDDAVCVTSRGTCAAPAGLPNTPCGCEIPGFGYKRGQIGD
ncbi:hypothetical protein MKK88_25375 [Methylobacterium sp. E-005]|uniref:hypothetical protein n=1 Tax=Methylobacterium sp. E-005 TaxID=2836549 RepID=UPI001FB8D556|nr:hypothetical protein [Methylobacterium sp. E-005]MCJ2089295.1 hypothetical protein [Methylobacterium sp. E-005]